MDSRRTRRCALLAAGSVALALALTGCGDDPELSAPAPTPSPSASPEPLDDAEWQTVASDTLEGYLEAGQTAAETRAHDIGVLTPWTTREIAARDIAQLDAMSADGVTVTGRFTVLNLVLTENAGAQASFNACLDTSTQLLEADDGSRVYVEGTADQIEREVHFESDSAGVRLIAQEPAETAGTCA